MAQCLNCRELAVESLGCFHDPNTHCQIMYWKVSYIQHTYDLQHNFERIPTTKKLNPTLSTLHNSNPAMALVSAGPILRSGFNDFQRNVQRD